MPFPRLHPACLALAAVLWAGCDAVGPVNEPPPAPPDTPAPLATVLDEARGFGEFARIASEVGLAGPTVLAPDDEAFSLMSPESTDGLRQVGSLGKLARRHVLSQPLDPESLSDGDQLATLEGTPIPVRVTDEGVVYLDGARLDPRIGVTEAGPVYRIARVLRSHLSVSERLGAAPILSRSTMLFEQAGIDLSQPGTYLVPIDLSYDQAVGGYSAFARSENRGLVRKTVRALVLPGAPQSAAELQARGVVSTSAGSSLRFTASNGLTMLGQNESRVLVADIPADGAIIHLIGLPPQGHLTLLERIAFVPDLASFSALLAQSGVNDVLRGDGPFTVFATRNEVFDALGADSRAALAQERPLADLVAGFQVSPRDIPAQAVVNPSEFPTLTDQQIRVRPNPVTDDIASLAGASLTGRVDIPAANGRLHIVDRLLSPDVPIYDQLVLSGFGTFRRVAQLAGYQGLLSSGTPVAVIAPRQVSSQLLLPGFECRAREVAGDHIIPQPIGLTPMTEPFDTSNLDILISPSVNGRGGTLDLRQVVYVDGKKEDFTLGTAEIEFINLRLRDGSILHGVDGRMRRYSLSFPPMRAPSLPICPST